LRPFGRGQPLHQPREAQHQPREVEPLARALGVTKGGFHWHFDDRRALLEEMLDTWERVSIDEVIEPVEGEGGDARTRLRRLFALASSSDEILAIDLAVRDWSRREPTVADRLAVSLVLAFEDNHAVVNAEHLHPRPQAGHRAAPLPRGIRS
jgi:AcrR family transcriptional regulator